MASNNSGAPSAPPPGPPQPKKPTGLFAPPVGTPFQNKTMPLFPDFSKTTSTPVFGLTSQSTTPTTKSEISFVAPTSSPKDGTKKRPLAEDTGDNDTSFSSLKSLAHEKDSIKRKKMSDERLRDIDREIRDLKFKLKEEEFEIRAFVQSKQPRLDELKLQMHKLELEQRMLPLCWHNASTTGQEQTPATGQK